MMVQRGAAIGVSWADELAALRGVDWDAARAAVEDTALRYPDYYLARRVLIRLLAARHECVCADVVCVCALRAQAPFHAYEGALKRACVSLRALRARLMARAADGNMSWQAALEVEVAAKSVHAVVFDPQVRCHDIQPLNLSAEF